MFGFLGHVLPANFVLFFDLSIITGLQWYSYLVEGLIGLHNGVSSFMKFISEFFIPNNLHIVRYFGELLWKSMGYLPWDVLVKCGISLKMLNIYTREKAHLTESLILTFWPLFWGGFPKSEQVKNLLDQLPFLSAISYTQTLVHLIH